MDSSLDQIRSYIREHLRRGISEDQIKNHLVTHGWASADVDRAFSQIDSSAYKPTASPSTALPPSAQPAPKKTSKKRKLTIIIVSIFAVLIAVAVLIIALAAKTAVPTLKTNVENVSRRNDASQLAYAASQYLVQHHNSPPTSVKVNATSGVVNVCGSVCKTGDMVTVTLKHYKASSSSVQFHDYSQSLQAPDGDTVYLVNRAICNADRTHIGEQSDDSSGLIPIAVIYAVPSGSSLDQQCLST